MATYRWEVISNVGGVISDFPSRKRAVESVKGRKAHGTAPKGIRIRRVRNGQSNPKRVKGAKVKGGRSVSLRNFTGRVIRKADGQVQIIGRMKKR